MFLNRKKSGDKSTDDRQRVLLYKKVFSSPEGKEVLIDLMNRNYVLNPTLGELRREGRREAILEILATTNVDMVQFDKLLKGELA